MADFKLDSDSGTDEDELELEFDRIGLVQIEKQVKHSKILYGQSSIKDSFKDDETSETYDIVETFKKLLFKEITPKDIPLIKVDRLRDVHRWVAVSGNRRLFIYKRLEKIKVLNTIPVMLSGDRGFFDEPCEEVRVRGESLRTRFDDIIREWRSQHP